MAHPYTVRSTDVEFFDNALVFSLGNVVDAVTAETVASRQPHGQQITQRGQTVEGLYGVTFGNFQKREGRPVGFG